MFRNSEAAKVCEGIAAATRKYGAGSEATSDWRVVIGVEQISAALDGFQECVRYLNIRRSKGAILQLENEADVQDALYLMLRPWITDLVTENPTDRTTNRYAISDFICPAARVLIEAKYIRDKEHGRAISRELHDDIEMYRRHPQCDHLIFFIYDPDSNIPDETQLATAICEERVIGGCALQCRLIIKP